MSSLLKKVGLIFDENKVKPYLKMSIQRLQLLINKKNNQVKAGKKDIARLLADGKEEKARIRVEQVIREDQTAEAYDIIELHCELVAGRVRFLASQKDCPLDMEQAVCTLIWASDRAEVSELSTVKDQFGKKYGAEFVRRAEINEGGCVNHKVVEKLQCDPPAGYVITQYLAKIAEEFDVEYEPTISIPLPETKAADVPTVKAPQPAREAAPRERPPGNGGATVTPSVNAWAVPGANIPQAQPTIEPIPGHAYVDMRGAPGAYPAGQAPYMQGQYVHPTPSDPPPTSGGSAGFDASAKGAGPDVGVARGKGEVKANDGVDLPPPYTPYDIPSPPNTKPVAPAPTFDIPAAPGYEDPPAGTQGSADADAPSAPPASSSDDRPSSPGGGLRLDDISARLQSLPGHVARPGPSDGDEDSGGGGGNMDDLAARLRKLRG